MGRRLRNLNRERGHGGGVSRAVIDRWGVGTGRHLYIPNTHFFPSLYVNFVVGSKGMSISLGIIADLFHVRPHMLDPLMGHAILLCMVTIETCPSHTCM